MSETRQGDIILRGLLTILVISSFTSDLRLWNISFSINLSQIVAIVLFGWLLVVCAINNLKIPIFYKDVTSFFIYLYFLSNLFSSLLYSSNRSLSLKGSAVIFIYVFIYMITRWAMKFVLNPQTMVQKMVKYNHISALIGLGCMFFALLTGQENFGISYDQLATAGISTLETYVPSIKSLAIEPNLFAISTAVVLSINLCIYLLWRKSMKELGIIVLLSVAIIFAYTRSVYIAIVISVLCLMVLSKRVKLLKSLASYTVVVLLIIGSLIIILPDASALKNALESRARTLIDFKSGSGLGRVEAYQIGYQGFLQNPLFGNGTLSADTQWYNPQKHEYGQRMGSPGWLMGLWIQALHDTGGVGLVIILCLFASVLYANYKIFKALSHLTIKKSIVLGFIGGNIIMFITAQLSSPLWISFPYIYWGINMAFLGHCREMIQRQDLPEVSVLPQ